LFENKHLGDIHIGEVNITMDCEEMGYEGKEWIEVIPDTVGSSGKAVANSDRKFLDQLDNYKLLKEDPFPCS
jgi:hypothetical protein